MRQFRQPLRAQVLGPAVGLGLLLRHGSYRAAIVPARPAGRADAGQAEASPAAATTATASAPCSTCRLVEPPKPEPCGVSPPWPYASCCLPVVVPAQRQPRSSPRAPWSTQQSSGSNTERANWIGGSAAIRAVGNSFMKPLPRALGPLNGGPLSSKPKRAFEPTPIGRRRQHPAGPTPGAASLLRRNSVLVVLVASEPGRCGVALRPAPRPLRLDRGLGEGRAHEQIPTSHRDADRSPCLERTRSGRFHSLEHSLDAGVCGHDRRLVGATTACGTAPHSYASQEHDQDARERCQAGCPSRDAEQQMRQPGHADQRHADHDDAHA